MTTNNTYYGGCDIGSTTGKAVIMDAQGEIAASAIVPRDIDPEESALAAFAKTFEDADLPITSYRDLAFLVGTGYGRAEIPFAGENISEISCHAMGVFHCDPKIKTIVDIGGQDVKGISIDKNGSVLEFAMNDKCAAGTGRFLEAMSRIFRLELEEFSNLSLTAKRAIPISAQCSVFAETEVVSLLAKKKSPAEIAAGIYQSVAKRCYTLIKRVGTREKVTISGGCAKNIGLVRELEKKLKISIAPLPVDPQLIGAIGAAVYAMKRG
jgi:predicted CoA-substrate-specific enzyme activase